MAHTRKSILGTALLALCVALTLALPATAKDLATVEIAGDAVFYPLGSQALRLTVSGPEGFTFDHTFAAGEPAVFAAYGAEGYGRADGLYTWELSVVAAGQASRQSDLADWKPSPATQSGAFTVTGGSIVNPDLPEGSLEKAQVIADDLIVKGSVCVGIDCASSESFGFDTFRLKENNLRIHFDDTSSSGSFPNNDWRIVINDSSNGGANYFAVEDATGGKTPFKIEAGAIANALYVDSEGDVGRSLAEPAQRLTQTGGGASRHRRLSLLAILCSEKAIPASERVAPAGAPAGRSRSLVSPFQADLYAK